MADYHDSEWGVPLHDDRALFELLTLEGAQAGLSWSTILRRREGYRHAFGNFEPSRVAAMQEADIDRLLADTGIIRNRQKITSAIGNARQFLAIQSEFGSFDRFVWGFVDGRPLDHAFTSMDQLPATTEESGRMSKALRQHGFAFVGPTICYAFMQSAGLVNDHLSSCPAWSAIHALSSNVKG
jgi:DNA-3-methyladenine glycosylase I